jgi:capsular exopolysaccharide synthesis family protein
MSRVDEALRRAAETAAGKGSPSRPSGSEFTLDDYVIERPDPPKLRSVSPPPPASPVDVPAPVLGLPFAELSVDGLGDGLECKVVVDRAMLPASREQYRRLAATLHQAQSTTGLKVILIVSAAAGEGKTLTATNLALTFSESYHRRVLLIDGDLRRPSLDSLFRVDGSPGLNEGLTSVVEHMMPVRQISPRLMVLPAGQATSDPIAGLTSERMRRLINEARTSFDWVIVDTPPVGILPDANLMASIADAVVLVIRAESTPYTLIQRAVEAIGRERIVGVVLNRATQTDGTDYYNRYYAMRQSGAPLP